MKKLIALAMVLSGTYYGFTQVGINTTNPDPSSILDIESSTSGLLIPRLTSTARDNINDPAVGLMFFNTTEGVFQYNSGTVMTPIWSNISYKPSVKYSNTNTAVNINTSAYTNIPIFGSLDWNDDTSLYSVSGNTITINVSGRYEMTANVSYVVPTVGGNSDQRVAVEAQFAINGTVSGSIAATGYVRHANGHTESSLNLTEVFNLSAGDVISIQTIRSGNSAAANFRSSGTSNIYIEKIK